MTSKYRTTEDRIATTLETAADRLESGEYQWRRGAYEEDGQVCAVGALRRAAAYSVTTARAAAEYMKPHLVDSMVLDPGIIDDLTGGGFLLTLNLGTVREQVESWGGESMVVTWNDRVAKDVSEVVEVMKLAAKDLRNQS